MDKGVAEYNAFFTFCMLLQVTGHTFLFFGDMIYW